MSEGSVAEAAAISVSAALCTYNGSSFVFEQIASIARQHQPPQELVVCDDGSIDETLHVLHGLSDKVQFRTRVCRNAVNLGSTKNFEKAISLCQSDVIALADQDDVWAEHKVGRLVDTFVKRQGIGFAFSDAEMVDEALRPLGYTLWEAIRLSSRERRLIAGGRAFEVLLRRNAVTGATMAFRADYRDLILPIPALWVHDAWIALLISAVADCALIEEPLIKYRQHPKQQIGGQKLGWYGQYLVAKAMESRCFEKTAEMFRLARERLSEDRGFVVRPGALEMIDEKIAHFEAKARMRELGARRRQLIWQELRSGRYRRYSQGWKSLAQDLFL